MLFFHWIVILKCKFIQGKYFVIQCEKIFFFSGTKCEIHNNNEK